MSTFPALTLLDGQPADPGALVPHAFAGFAHFTAMQVRDGAVRGLDLHLDRLAGASRTLFGADLARERVLADLRTAVAASPPDLSLVLTVFDATGEFTNDSAEPALHTLIRTTAPANGPRGPLSLAIYEHERFMPEIKHVGEGAKTYYMRRARAAGFDDAAFVDRKGRLSEASIWNLAFWDGDTVVWPEAAVLTGTMMGVVRRRLHAAGIPQRTQPIRPTDVPGFGGAVVLNSWTPGIAVNRIGETVLGGSSELVGVLHAAYESEPPAALADRPELDPPSRLLEPDLQ
ncbi:aminotransferase class IV family protein [Nocardia cyriacigeorgica]|uniref:Branched-chain amino acid aminotransferase/4-amino-4-deoxychorismate lyase n=1 Tax=Nocardia cyriacigeorgica TaxID=135487 RepID=A0A4U8WEC1_9NOCA|nr:aminotransferase class IV family protein [Nocardia cyriacigeorgica]MBF6098959.1 aminotransferase class IV family protein [Nocardia cyriacigeorgica]MBF6159485.1 aminotransferase class IV family protein [Nocardia cyriacigeorgica]MBF6198568.1 aminotransferase class IV family protein [Nocardia cyriacigeorgica]MBF6342628.1 aminotransferase class IV family protein [Nocardia cyriacigeorgica]MBF6515023.1 aminotransferase class IV family protein [Nocardia cyriacigeorgica]